MTTTDTRPYTYEFTVSREAVDTISAMRDHVARLGAYYGQNSTEYRVASESLYRQLATLFGSPLAEKSRVSRDGDLSLLVVGGITFGVIWHGSRRHCTTDGCKAYVNDDGHVWTYSRDDAVLDHEHELSYALDAPQPGSWSFHS